MINCIAGGAPYSAAGARHLSLVSEVSDFGQFMIRARALPEYPGDCVAVDRGRHRVDE